MHAPSITESPNELTTDIDVASPEEMVRLLRASDAQIYNGYRGFPALCDDVITAKIVQAVKWAAPLMGRRARGSVLSGAGTSGRLAMFAARMFNQFLRRRGKEPNFRHLIAGTNLALIKAQEKAEDDPHQAWTDVEPLIEGRRNVLYIGITCAFAAPYVASQLLRVSEQRGGKCILIGFNPEDRARTLEVENWDKPFADVVRTISNRKNCLILNPVVGPEPITGSTRMKGGSATKLLLEVIFALGARQAGLLPGGRGRADLADQVRAAVQGYENTRVAAYSQAADIAHLISRGGHALRHGGHIYYVGSAAQGILGIVDASECPPTFGAAFGDVRGFLVGGWRSLLGPEHDLSEAGPWYRISLDNFLEEIAPTLTKHDLVVALPGGGREPKLTEAVRTARRAGAATAMIRAGGSDHIGLRLDAAVFVPDVPRSLLPGTSVYGEYATKLVFNALTTGAHVLTGKVYRNRMVDLRISNNKLWHRSIGIVSDIMGVCPETAKRCLLRSLYGVDRVTPALNNAKPSKHVEAATEAAKVVPRALILAGSGASYAEAERLLKKEPVVRTAIERLKAGK